jgi:outer membrane lipoprotein SlyB
MNTINRTTGWVNKAWWAGGAAALVALGAVGANLASTWGGPGEAHQVAISQPEAPAKAKAPVRTTTTAANKAVADSPACTNCGVVESVTPVTIKGEGSGLGAVAGGVIGGVVGHQMGGGRGKDAMTVIGAVGGGVAGHEIEKRQRSNTAYQVKVRMSDGSLRTLTQVSSPVVGQRVQLDGQQLKLLG